MKMKQLLSPTGERIGGVHPAVARKMVRSGDAEEREGQLHLVARVNPLRGHLEYAKKEIRWYPITHGLTWEVEAGSPTPAHCVLHLYVDDPYWGAGRYLEIITRKGGRMWTREWHQSAEIVDDEMRWVSVEEWLRRLDQGEPVTAIKGVEEMVEGNVWVLHQTPEGQQSIQMWVALHYPVPLNCHEDDCPPTKYPCTFIAAIRFDFNRRVVLDDWWNIPAPVEQL